MGFIGEDTGKTEEVKISPGTETENPEPDESSEVSLEDIHSQNERIISLLEELVVEDEMNEQEGDFDGVL